MSNLRNLVASIPGARAIKRALLGQKQILYTRLGFPKDRGSPQPVQTSSGAERTPDKYSGLHSPDSFVLYRIIGNDLVPRHEKGQSRRNLAFILENEPVLPGCEKRFVVNRIVDPEEERCIIDLLDKAGYPYIHIPFEWEEYVKQPWDIHGVPLDFCPLSKKSEMIQPGAQRTAYIRQYRYKNNYVMNNNGARNVALRDGKLRAKWVLPWDGNCFLTASAWEAIRQMVMSNSAFPYQIVPMARIVNNDDLLNPVFSPEATEEPQVLFRADSREEFDPAYCYGRRPKVELLWRLGVSGSWDIWPIEPWDLPCPSYSVDAGRFGHGGWVARLFSGKAELEKQRSEKASIGRGEARSEAITCLLDNLDSHALDNRLDPDRPIFIEQDGPTAKSKAVIMQLKAAAGRALGRGPFSVIDKTTLPPSKNRHDYWHPAPYYWPNPLKIPGLPYVQRDGQRVPGTRLYEPTSERYDRTRLQYVFDDTYVLALAWLHFGDEEYGRHGAEFIRRWFLRPETAMTPHLNYSQVRRGHNRNRGTGRGIIEFKDMYYFLDAVRVLRNGGFLSEEDDSGFRSWLRQYLTWLQDSQQGRNERFAMNNHGTYYDLQVAAICAYLGEARLLRHVLRDSRFRILAQFDETGAQPLELSRTATAHYCCFNLQGWVHLAKIAETVGEDLWHFTGESGSGIQKGMEWLLSHVGRPWKHQQIDQFDTDRFFPIAYCYEEKYDNSGGLNTVSLPDAIQLKPLFNPHDGVRPFWNYEMRDSEGGVSTESDTKAVTG